MSLRDAACYTLTLVPSLQDPKVLELVENYNGPSSGPRAQVSRFARVRETKEGEVYSAAIHGERRQEADAARMTVIP